MTRPVQPKCTGCGITDVNFVRAAAAGWRRVLGRLRCRPCASGFPAWMHHTF
ncbi:hypothetical protein [Streptomyces silvensis]|uniref:hypothetical protein n=1 Tax=Streptomyces silvensis TaxID=1765722 RepID=UPI000AC70586|nr:hypothetical protein [Streptomyces silvensis]